MWGRLRCRFWYVFMHIMFPNVDISNIGTWNWLFSPLLSHSQFTDCIGDDLICYQRWQIESVPFCEGRGVRKRDYCAYRPPDYLLHVGNDLGVGAYGLCEGDCDKDSDCIGDLKCFRRSCTTPVEGNYSFFKFSSPYETISIPTFSFCLHEKYK